MTILRRIGALLALVLIATPAFAGTPTTNYAWVKPTPGADADTWGATLNTDLDGIDSTVFGMLPKAGGTMTGLITLAPSTTGHASLNLANGTAPTSPVNGDLWAASGLVKYRSAGTTVTMATLEGAQVFTGAVTAASFSGPLTGNASTATALATGRTLSITGDLTWTSPTFDGSGNVTAAGTLAASGATAGTYGGSGTAAQVTVDAKGRVTAASSVGLAPLWAQFRYQAGSGVANTETLTQNTWVRRTLNTTVANTIPSVALASNQLSLPAGTYRVVVATTAYSASGGGLLTRIRNITDSTTLALSSAGALWATFAQSGMVAEFTLAGTKTVEVQSYSNAPGTTGGFPTTSGESEIYVDIFIEKVG